MQVLELIHTGNWQLLAFVMKNTIMCSRDQFWYQQTVWLNNLFVNSTYNILVEWYFCLKICWQQHDSLHQCIYHVYTFINLCFYKMPKQWEHLTWLTKVLIFFQFSSLIFQVVLKVVRWKLGSCTKSLVSSLTWFILGLCSLH